jgi:hypothetical protein
VPADADEAAIEAGRQELDRRLRIVEARAAGMLT